MSAVWKKSRQWRAYLREDSIQVDIVVSHDDGALQPYSWFLDGFDRSTLLSAEPVAGTADGLRTAKLNALVAARSLLFRMVQARGGQ